MECIAIINQKGGVGKTATAVNLGAALATRGKRVLLLDMDPQGHLTLHFGMDGDASGTGIYEVLTQNVPLESAIHARSSLVSVIPARVDLAAAETELVSVVGREMLLRDAIAVRSWPYDVALVDCPPSLGVLTLNALSAADRVLIPVQPHFLALQGTGKLFETISLVSQRLNPHLGVTGIVMCLYESGTRLSAEVVDDLSAFLASSRDKPVPWREARIFETRIRRNIKLAECAGYGQSIFEYAPKSNGAADYLALADELWNLLSPTTPGSETAAQAGDESEAAATEPVPSPVSAPMSHLGLDEPAAPIACPARTVSPAAAPRAEAPASPEAADAPPQSDSARTQPPAGLRDP